MKERLAGTFRRRAGLNSGVMVIGRRYLGERAHEEVMPRIDEAIVRIVKSGKAAGILADGEVTARRWLALGALFVAVGSDLGLLARGAEALAAAFSKDRA